MQLHLRVVEAVDVPKMDADSSDPYCIIEVPQANRKEKTTVIKNSLTPRWNQEFHIPITNISTATLLITMKDKDIAKDDKISTLDISLCSIPFRTVIDQWYNMVSNTKKKGGRLHLVIHIAQNGDQPFVQLAIPGTQMQQGMPGMYPPGQYPPPAYPVYQGVPPQGQYPGPPVQGQYPGAPVQGQYPGAPVQGQYPGAPVQGQYQGAPVQGQYPGAPVQGQYQGAPVQGQYPGAPVQGQYPTVPPQGQYPDTAQPVAPQPAPQPVITQPAPQPVTPQPAPQPAPEKPQKPHHDDDHHKMDPPPRPPGMSDAAYMKLFKAQKRLLRMALGGGGLRIIVRL